MTQCNDSVTSQLTLSCLAVQDEQANAQKDSYANARKAAEDKAAEFDKVRDAARALNKELNEKSRLLKEQESEVTRLAVSFSATQFKSILTSKAKLQMRLIDVFPDSRSCIFSSN